MTPSLVDRALLRRADEQCAVASLAKEARVVSRQNPEVLSVPTYAQPLVKSRTEVCFTCDRPRSDPPCHPPLGVLRARRFRQRARFERKLGRGGSWRIALRKACDQWQEMETILERTEYAKTVKWERTR